MTINVLRYSPKWKSEWDDFIEKSINGTFLFHRDFMDYHSDLTENCKQIFEDHSIIFREGEEIRAVIPANDNGTTLASHSGLTYGGLVIGESPPDANEIVSSLQEYAKKNNYEDILYKSVPHIYYSEINEGVEYELIRQGGELEKVEISSVIKLNGDLDPKKNRRRGIDDAIEHGLTVRETDQWGDFWEILRSLLEARHGVEPTHTLDEIRLLKSRFPENIRLFGAFDGNDMMAGVVIFETEMVAHMQYNANTLSGRDIGANDLLHYKLLKDEYNGEKEYYDFGISTEEDGTVLNEGLLNYKESFGASGVTYDTYRLPTDSQ